MDVGLPHSKPVMNAVSHMKPLSLSFAESLTVSWSVSEGGEGRGRGRGMVLAPQEQTTTSAHR